MITCCYISCNYTIYSGAILFKTKNEKYNASNVLAEMNTVHTIFVVMFWLSYMH
jgi:hypothetical protein